MLLNHLLDRFELQVDRHLNWSEMLSNYIRDHFALDICELLFKVFFLKLSHRISDILHSLMAVTKDMILTVLHLFHLKHLLLELSNLILARLFFDGQEAFDVLLIERADAQIDPLDVRCTLSLELSDLICKFLEIDLIVQGNLLPLLAFALSKSSFLTDGALRHGRRVIKIGRTLYIATMLSHAELLRLALCRALHFGAVLSLALLNSELQRRLTFIAIDTFHILGNSAGWLQQLLFLVLVLRRGFTGCNRCI